MRKAALLALFVAALAGCSKEPSPQRDDPPPASAVRQRGAATSTSPAMGAGSALTGEVSGLNSAVSGLEMHVTKMGTVIALPADTLFEFDSAKLTPAATEQLTKSAQVIREAPAGAIQIVGHTDSKGDEVYNLGLSQRRAQAVADWFGQQVGIRQRPFQVRGMGETSPIAPNQTSDGSDDPNGRARNRRVEIIVPNKP